MTVETSLLWGAVGVALIAVVLVGLWLDVPSLRPAMSRPEGTEPLIKTRRLTKRYDTLTAVDHLDLEVRPGEIFGLLGQNGAGKTTTILMLLGLTEPTSGGALVAGLDPTRHPREVKRRVGYLPDAVGFYGGLTGRQNLRYTARLNGLTGSEAETAMAAVLDQVGLTERADDRVETYSRGMKQRLGIADALVKAPDILILDEPTTSIDPLGVVEILELLRTLVQERDLAILLSSHLLTQVQSVCDRIGIFAAGRMVGEGTMARLASLFGDGSAGIEVDIEGTDACRGQARRGRPPRAAARHRRDRADRAIDDVAHRGPPRDRGDERPERDPRRGRRQRPAADVAATGRAVARRHLPHGAPSPRSRRPRDRGREDGRMSAETPAARRTRQARSKPAPAPDSAPIPPRSRPTRSRGCPRAGGSSPPRSSRTTS